MSDVDPVHITAREIYDTVVETRDAVRKLVERDEDVKQILADHESRIRTNERWRYALPVALLMSLGSVLAALS